VRASGALRLGSFPAPHRVVAEEHDPARRHIDARQAEIADIEGWSVFDASTVGWPAGTSPAR
jgi:hypothetical protein